MPTEINLLYRKMLSFFFWIVEVGVAVTVAAVGSFLSSPRLAVLLARRVAMFNVSPSSACRCWTEVDILYEDRLPVGYYTCADRYPAFDRHSNS